MFGFLLEEIFNDKWWDYSHKPFNLKGYICLSFSLIWGLGALFVIYIIHPLIMKFISLFENTLGLVLGLVLIAYFIADLIVTLTAIFKINKSLRLMEAMSDRLKNVSDTLGENIYKSTQRKGFIHKRLEKSYPNIKEKLDKLEEKYK